MDFLKKAATQFSESSNSNNQNQNQNSGEQNNNNQQQQNTNVAGTAPTTNNAPSTEQSSDYGDKAFDFVSKKAGYDLSPEVDEKVTDGLRSAYESYSGKKLDSKYSN